ncbi:hypothetical protein ACFV9C_28240 [Kribbella sp. NPDC059898]|uniref:hypothetical protein n=1 Tax=Kribbella sp. NPDC059898 TaxID=3346995 RepID=UPI003650E0F9
MSRLTGAGEQRGAEVIDEHGDTVPLPVVPSGSDPEQPGRHPGQPGPFAPVLKKVALAVAVCLVAGAGYAGLQYVANAPAGTNTRGSHQPVTTPSTDQAQAGVQRAVAGQAVLQKMADAVTNDNRGEFLNAVDPQSTAFQANARMMFGNLSTLPISGFQLRYVSDDSTGLTPDRKLELGGTQAWLAQVEVSWQLSGFDLTPARETLPVTFVTRDGTTYAASFSERFAAGQRRPIWALGPLELSKGKRSLVIGLGSEADTKSYVSVADKAVESVSKVWGKKWRQKVIVYLPAKQAQMEGILGAQPNTYTQIAAVTMAELDQPAANAPVRIVANPKLFEELGKQGRRIVLTHETTHVASNATASPVPLWLAEGFADYVAFTAVPVQDDSAAKELFKAVRAGKVPATLPTPEAFAASAADLPQAYESAWLACRLIAEHEGQDKLVALYHAVDRSGSATGLADAFKSVLGMTEAEFVVQWQKYLKRLAGA